MSDIMELTFEAIAIKNDIGYASDYDVNGLYKVNMITGECRYISAFSSEDTMKKRIHSCAKWINDRIYFIPSSGEHIDIFDINTGSIRSLKIPVQECKIYSFYIEKFKFVEAVEDGKYLWLVPATYPGIVRLDLQNDDIHVINQWIPQNGFFNRKAVCDIRGKLYIPNGNSNEVFIFDKENQSVVIEKIGEQNNGIMSSCNVDGTLWMSPRFKGAIISWNVDTNVIKEYVNYPSDFVYNRVVSSKIYYKDGSITVSPADANKGLYLKEGKLEIDNKICWKEDSESMLEFLFETDDELFYREYFMDTHSRYFKIRKTDSEITTYSFYVTNADKHKDILIKMALNRNELLRESTELRLEDFIRNLI